MLGEDRRAAGAVHVVVAEDRHRLAALDRVGEPLDRRLHVAQHAWVGEQVAQAGAEEGGDVAQGDAAAGEHAAERVGQAVGLGDRGGDRLLARIAAIDPGAAERGAGDPEKRARFEDEGLIRSRGEGKPKARRLVLRRKKTCSEHPAVLDEARAIRDPVVESPRRGVGLVGQPVDPARAGLPRALVDGFDQGASDALAPRRLRR